MRGVSLLAYDTRPHDRGPRVPAQIAFIYLICTIPSYVLRIIFSEQLEEKIIKTLRINFSSVVKRKCKTLRYTFLSFVRGQIAPVFRLTPGEPRKPFFAYVLLLRRIGKDCTNLCSTCIHIYFCSFSFTAGILPQLD